MSQSLSVLPESTTASQHPVAVYLARLAPSGRRTQAQAIDRVASMLAGDSVRALDLPAAVWASVRYQHVAAVRAALIESGAAPATCAKLLSAIRGVLRESWRLGLLSAEDLARAVDVEPVRGERLPAGRALDSGELRALFAHASPRDAALLALLYGAGLRRAEVVALGFADVDLVSGEVIVRHGKGGKDRRLWATNGGLEALRAWASIRGDAPGAFLLAVDRGGTVRDPLTTQAVYLAVRRLAARAGVRAPSPHDLRRSYASDLLDAGADLATVQALMGHSSPTTTARYDRRGDVARRKASSMLHVPYIAPAAAS